MKALFSTLAVVLCAGIASANISVQGEGKASYVPDIAFLNLSVSSEGKTATEAWKANQESMKKLFQILKDHGIDEKDFKTSGLNVSPKYFHPKEGPAQIVGYTVSHQLSITVRKLADLGSTLDDMVANGADRMAGISFGFSNPQALLDLAREEAVKDARRKAEIFAKGAGVKLGAVVSISEYHVSSLQSYSFDMAPGYKGMPIAVGQQDMKVNVTVVFKFVDTNKG